jgi:hypothetical protein
VRLTPGPLVAALLLAGCANGYRGGVAVADGAGATNPDVLPAPDAEASEASPGPEAGSEASAPQNNDGDGDKIPDEIDPRPTMPDKVHYFGYAGSKSGDFVAPGPGGWEPSGGSLCKVGTKDSESIAVLQEGLVAVPDYTVETRLDVQGVGSPWGSWADAGLALRATAPGGWSSKQYQCLVDLDNRRLVVGGLFNGDWEEMSASPDKSVPATGPYRIRATVKGNQLTCQLVPGPTVQATDSALSGGSCGFTTDFSSTCFEYLLVVEPDP